MCYTEASGTAVGQQQLSPVSYWLSGGVGKGSLKLSRPACLTPKMERSITDQGLLWEYQNVSEYLYKSFIAGSLDYVKC